VSDQQLATRSIRAPHSCVLIRQEDTLINSNVSPPITLLFSSTTPVNNSQLARQSDARAGIEGIEALRRPRSTYWGGEGGVQVTFFRPNVLARAGIRALSRVNATLETE